MDVLVTGGCGYVGSQTVWELRQRGHDVTVIDDFSRAGLRPSQVPFSREVKVAVGRVSDIAERVMSDRGSRVFDVVIHLAAFAHVGESVREPGMYFENNVSESIFLLDLLRRYGIPHLVFASSSAVYGGMDFYGGQLLLRENDACWPVSPYGVSKRVFEMVLQSSCEADPTMSAIALRYFNVVGASSEIEHGPRWFQPKHPRILDAIFDGMFGGRFVVSGSGRGTVDGTAVRDYVHLKDVAFANVVAAEHLFQKTGVQKSFEIFNVGTGVPVSVKGMMDTVVKVTGRKFAVAYTEGAASDPDSAVADISKAIDVIGWTPTYTLQDMIESAWKWRQSFMK